MALHPADYWDLALEERREADRQIGLVYPELPDFKILSMPYEYPASEKKRGPG